MRGSGKQDEAPDAPLLLQPLQVCLCEHEDAVMQPQALPPRHLPLSSYSRSRCASANMRTPRCSLRPSHTPSPRMKPLSSTETRASGRHALGCMREGGGRRRIEAAVQHQALGGEGEGHREWVSGCRPDQPPVAAEGLAGPRGHVAMRAPHSYFPKWIMWLCGHEGPPFLSSPHHALEVTGAPSIPPLSPSLAGLCLCPSPSWRSHPCRPG